MPPIRILVVDDAVVARTVISEILNQEDGLQVVGTAPNGRIALTKIARLQPDLVTLDIDMPVMNGLEVTEPGATRYTGGRAGEGCLCHASLRIPVCRHGRRAEGRSGLHKRTSL